MPSGARKIGNGKEIGISMKIGDESTLAGIVRNNRRRQGLSQDELAELARVSTKTVQRMEAAKSSAGSSRRAVLAVFGIEPEDVGQPLLDQPGSADVSWFQVRERDARSLLRSLAAAKNVDVEIDREGWRQARQSRPWYRRDLVVATGDVVALIVDIVDRATESSERLPGHEAKQQDDLAQLIRGAEAMSWALATRVGGAGALSLYIGSPVVVEQRVRRPHLG